MGRENQPQRQLSSLIGNCRWSFAVHRVHYSSKLFFPIGSQCHSPPSPGGEREQHWCGASKQHRDCDHSRGGWVSCTCTFLLLTIIDSWLFSSAIRAAKVGSSGGSFGDGAESLLAGGETIYFGLSAFYIETLWLQLLKVAIFPTPNIAFSGVFWNWENFQYSVVAGRQAVYTLRYIEYRL